MWDMTNKIIETIRKRLDETDGPKGVDINLSRAEAVVLKQELNSLINRTLLWQVPELATRNLEPEITKVHCLYDTADMMVAKDYKTRFYAEYWQLKIRYEKLKKLNTRIEAANRAAEPAGYYPRMENEMKQISMPKHDCPEGMLRAQQCAMEEYLHILELRAVIEGIDLDPEA